MNEPRFRDETKFKHQKKLNNMSVKQLQQVAAFMRDNNQTQSRRYRDAAKILFNRTSWPEATKKNHKEMQLVYVQS